MAIQIKSVIKVDALVMDVTVEDTGDTIGTAADGATPIFRTYTVRHNANLSNDVLKAKIEEEIARNKAEKTEQDTLKASLDLAVSSIDTAKISSEGVI